MNLLYQIYFLSLKLNTSIGATIVTVGAPTLWNVLPSSVRSVEKIAKCRQRIETTLQPCLSTIAPWHISQSDDNWICLLTLRSIKPFCGDAPLSLVSKDLGATEVT